MKGENISIRLRRFAALAVRLCQTFPKGLAAKHILGQLVRAATSGGANYWLRLVQDAELAVSGDVDALVREADELVAILTASIKTAKQHEATSCAEARSRELDSTQRVDHGRSVPATGPGRIGNREPRTGKENGTLFSI